jgi:hypothetical protein
MAGSGVCILPRDHDVDVKSVAGVILHRLQFA